MLERKIIWAELWRKKPLKNSFMIRSNYDTLPSPSNLHQWGLIEEPGCKLCGEREILDVERKKKRPKTEEKQTRFVREGDTGHAKKSQQHFIFDMGSEWNMRANNGKKLVFPECVNTTLRTYIVVWLQKSKMIVAEEQKVPWEKRCEEIYQRKKEKYTELMTTCRERERLESVAVPNRPQRISSTVSM
ncbi:unnamed protein product [Mytilus coruscus]|uniref:Uncharacterized protein n=1 Tax=Mytilus coruscus TaxID=42192 RepID=A0A6J8CVY2_MYTCO|nr:unnamed protein product [Mytilus coruscus]